MKTVLLAVLTALCIAAASPDEIRAARDAVQAAAAEVSAAGDNLEARTEAARKLMDARRRLAALEAPAAPATTPAAKPAAQPTSRPAAKRVVFVLDASGSMMNSIEDARAQVRLAIERLPASAWFSVIIDRGVPRQLGRELLPANDANRRQAIEFLDDVSVHGLNNLPAAIEAAARMRPELIWLASDGDVSNGTSDVRERVAAANPRRVPINTVLHFVGDSRATAPLLIAIAADSGGICLGADGQAVEDVPEAPPARQGGKASIFE